MPLLDLSQALTQNQGWAKGPYNKITSRPFIMADYLKRRNIYHNDGTTT